VSQPLTFIKHGERKSKNSAELLNCAPWMPIEGLTVGHSFQDCESYVVMELHVKIIFSVLK